MLLSGVIVDGEVGGGANQLSRDRMYGSQSESSIRDRTLVNLY